MREAKQAREALSVEIRKAGKIVKKVELQDPREAFVEAFNKHYRRRGLTAAFTSQSYSRQS